MSSSLWGWARACRGQGPPLRGYGAQREGGLPSARSLSPWSAVEMEIGKDGVRIIPKRPLDAPVYYFPFSG